MTVAAAVRATPRAKRILVSAGEPSADLHTAGVVAALRDAVPGARCVGLGGPHMARAGARLTARMEPLTTIGFTQVVRTLPAHARVLRAFRRALDGNVDLALLTDYPGFHLRVARLAARRGVPVLYYIAPQLWAWGESRVAALRESVAHLAVILPFEEPFFARRGVPTTFVGHPLLDRARPGRGEARAALGLAPGSPVLGLFPGSRPSEVRRLWPVLRGAADLVRAAVPEAEVLVAALPGLSYPGAEGCRLRMGQAPTVMAASDAAICKSGTSTLEAALADTPSVACYRTDPVSYAIAKRVIRCRHIGLVNLVAGRSVTPECVQRRAIPQVLARHALALLDRDGPAAARQREGLAEVRERLGTPGASRRVADLARELVAC